MKFLSLFTKVPQHQRFNYSPRFYDPRKEEMEEREKRITDELKRERGPSEGDLTNYKSRIAGSFQAARKRSAPSQSTGILRLAILMYLAVFVWAYLTWGSIALYSLLVFIPFYFYLRLKRK